MLSKAVVQALEQMDHALNALQEQADWVEDQGCTEIVVLRLHLDYAHIALLALKRRDDLEIEQNRLM